ncbi:MAG: type VI secretion system-associated FHA domain protein [Thiolinea sp.]
MRLSVACYCRRVRAFLPATQALEEAFEDVRAHQVAVIAGQAALKQVLKRFEPERLEARLHKESPIIANIPIQREASLWALFETLYSTIQGEAEDDFQKLFG